MIGSNFYLAKYSNHFQLFKHEKDRPNLQGQIGHRDQDEMLKDADTDFPEPGSSPEHSGESAR